MALLLGIRCKSLFQPQFFMNYLINFMLVYNSVGETKNIELFLNRLDKIPFLFFVKTTISFP